jgi:hypothetical protein
MTDTGWYYDTYTSRPERGLRDYRRRIMFDSKISDDDAQNYACKLKDGQPGWFTVEWHRLSGNEIQFTSYADSSD